MDGITADGTASVDVVLAFIGSLSYETTFQEDDVEHGDAIGVAIGAVLAASSATSLRTVLSQSFVDETRSTGRRSAERTGWSESSR